MNRKQFGILLVLLVILGGAGLLVQRNREREAGAGESGAGRKLLGDNFPYNDVAHIRLKQNTDELNLVKTNDTWCVYERDDYPANYTQVSDLLLTVGELKAVQVLEVGPSQLARLGLAPAGQGTNSGLVLDLLNKDDKTINTLVLGKKHVGQLQQTSFPGEMAMPDGRYVMVGNDSGNAMLIDDPLTSFEPKPDKWLKQGFFKVERPKSIAVAFPEGTNSWKIVRDMETGDWKLTDARGDEKLDTNKVAGVENPFSSPSFDDVVPASMKPADNGLDNPTVITVGTFDDFVYTVKIGRKSGNNYPLTMTVTADFPKERIPGKDEKPEEKSKLDQAFNERQKQLEDKLKQAKVFENRTYLVGDWNVDPVLKERKDLLVEKKAEEKK